VAGAPESRGLEAGTIARQRLRTQRLAGAGFDAPADVVRWFGAVQAQDYAGALWAVGMRASGATEADVEQAIANRAIVRTWPLRGTIHFVAPEDVRWMLTHFAPRTIARAASRFRQLELDARVLAKGRALQGGRQLTRPRLYALLERAGIATGDNRGLHILWRCAHDGLICFAARDGKQPTFALLEEWVPRAKMRDRDEALAELARRYFTSHGPATLQDFSWWSGLSAADARKAEELAAEAGAPHLASSHLARRTSAPRTSLRPHAVLLPPYDEYTVAYRDRSAALDPADAAAAKNGILGPTIVLDGRIVGTWTRQLSRDVVAIALKPFAPLTGARARSVAAAANRYARFIDRPARIV
jgi:Winged helix DNA-binding domain